MPTRTRSHFGAALGLGTELFLGATSQVGTVLVMELADWAGFSIPDFPVSLVALASTGGTVSLVGLASTGGTAFLAPVVPPVHGRNCSGADSLRGRYSSIT
jgi:hypothetical protein